MDKQWLKWHGVERYPAPWHLRGKGYLFLFKFDRDFVAREGLVPAFLQDSFAGGPGAVMMVDYSESDAGPYGELLFIPGKFQFGGKKLYCITKIYVSTRESAVNGWENWAIPKEQADFFWSPKGGGREEVAVSRDGEPVVQATLGHGGIAFPMYTALMPFPLVQERDGRHYYTNFRGKGRAQYAQINDMRVNPALFPDVSLCHPLMGIRVDPFEITFPAAQVTEMLGHLAVVRSSLPIGVPAYSACHGD